MEVNCETDFVARSDDFCEMVELLCMQLTVSPDIRFISSSQVQPSFCDSWNTLLSPCQPSADCVPVNPQLIVSPHVHFISSVRCSLMLWLMADRG